MQSQRDKNIIILLVALLLAAVCAQNYHFSNGWHPGKRAYQPCRVSSQIKTLVTRIIEDEAQRLQHCLKADMGDLFSLLQVKESSNNIGGVISDDK